MQTIPNHKFRRGLLIGFGIVLLGNAAAAAVNANLHAGIWFTCAAGGILLVWCLLFDWFPRVVHGILVFGVTAAAICVLSLFLFGRSDNADYREDAVIVLGTGVRGTELSEGLRNRLDAAVTYHAKNPDAVIAVSGGQGPQEDIPEGVAMERYLLEHGIPQEKIIRETASSSTAENFRFTKPLLDRVLPAGYRIVYISSDFHIFRAGLIAADCGLTGAVHCHAPTPWYMLIPNGLRECAAMVKYWLGI